MSLLERRFVSVALAAALVPFARSASADEVRRDVCFDSYEQAQRLRVEGKLRAASAHLAVCVDSACPAFVRKDCSAWLDDVQSRISGLVVRASGERGSSAQVPIFLDGERVADGIDGRAIPVDPGPHELSYDLDGRSHQQHVIVPEGDKTFAVVLDAPWSAARPQPPAPEQPSLLRLPKISYALGGGAVLGLGAFAAFALAGHSVQQCAPACSPSQVSTLRRDYLIADISLGAAAVAAAGAVYFALTTQQDSPNGARPSGAHVAAWWLGVGVEGWGPSLDGGIRF